ncbi:MAG: nucleotide exchange factor GrpE [Synergistaceae bacterium]|nr:nucleotide exchange factor GrpE [Synergistaceae bacterium]
MNDEETKQEDTQELQENEAVNTEPDTKDERIKSLEQQVKTVTADFFNYRQRTTKERSETRKHATEDVITAILPVLDNLDRALDAANTEDTASIIKGVDMVRRQFVGVLENLGMSIIKSEGEKFDPALHDAAGTENVEDPELDGKVIAERLKGYRTKDRVLRPAQVIVGKKA